jgi:hypothetical protein
MPEFASESPQFEPGIWIPGQSFPGTSKFAGVRYLHRLSPRLAERVIWGHPVKRRNPSSSTRLLQAANWASSSARASR